MFKNKRLSSGLLLCLMALAGVGLLGPIPLEADHHDSRAEEDSIVDVAADGEQFSTLVKAIKAAGLTDTLQGEGPFTVFAPDNQAFEQLPEGKLDQLLKPENRDQLKELLTYHVVPGRIDFVDVMAIEGVHSSNGSVVETVQGNQIKIKVVDDTVMVDGATVTKPDIEASNGVIHVIDGVLNPSNMSTQRATGMLQATIEKGVPMYNQGHHGRTAELYRKTSMRVLNSDDGEVPEQVREVLQHSTGLADQMEDESERAWVLRYGMDAALKMLDGSSGRMNR